MKKKELIRIKNVIPDGADYTFKCHVCQKQKVLHSNGGEMDATSCCGIRYGLEIMRVDFVATREA